MSSEVLLPQCTVCNKVMSYREGEPNLLPCLHPVCSDCLSKDCTSVSCTPCGESFNKSEYIFLRDPVTQTVILHSTLKSKPWEIKCTNNPHENVAAIWCKDYRIFYCKACQESHSQVKISHVHEIVMMKELTTTRTCSTTSRCTEHEAYILDLYDATCEVVICSKCAREEHKQCKTEELDAAAKDVKEVLEDDQKKVQQKLNDTQTALNEIKRRKGKTHRGTKSMKKRVTNHFDHLRALITQREQDLLNELDVRQNSVHDEIEAVNNKLESSVQRLNVVFDYTKKLLTHTASDIIVLGNNVKSRTEICLAEEVGKSSFDGVRVNFSKDRLEDLEMILSSSGQIVCDEKGDDLYLHPVHEQETEDPLIVDSPTTLIATKGADGTDDKDHGDKGTFQEDDQTYNDCMSAKTPVCPKLLFDSKRLNADKVHISNKGVLINDKLPTGIRFQHYFGTVSTSPLPRQELSYWEVETDIQIDEEMKNFGMLLEIGVVEGIDKGMRYCASGHANSRCLIIAHCADHKGICANTWNCGTRMGCKKDVFIQKTGASCTLKHGVLFDDENNSLSFFDLNKMTSLGILKRGKSDKELWPIFGVFNPALAAIKMVLVSEDLVQLTDQKLALLTRAKGIFV